MAKRKKYRQVAGALPLGILNDRERLKKLFILLEKIDKRQKEGLLKGGVL